MNKQLLQEKLEKLRAELVRLETQEAEKIRKKRIMADMGDDYRENEAAKLTMEDHNLLHLRILNLKKEIWEMKKEMRKCRTSIF